MPLLAAGNRVTICARNWISFYISATAGNFLRLGWNRHGVDAAAGADGELLPLPGAVLPRLRERHRAARSRPSLAIVGKRYLAFFAQTGTVMMVDARIPRLSLSLLKQLVPKDPLFTCSS